MTTQSLAMLAWLVGVLLPGTEVSSWRAWDSGAWGVLNRNNQFRRLQSVRWLAPFSGDRAEFSSDETIGCGYVDTAGVVVIAPKFATCGRFEKGIAGVCD